MHKTKIEKLRWHKQKFIIRCIAWLTILSFLIVLLLMGFPIVSDASETKISDKFFCNDFYDINKASDLYNLTDAQLSPFISSEPFKYYSDVKTLFNLPFPDSSQISYDTQNDFMIFTKRNDTNKLVIVFSNSAYFNLYEGTPYLNFYSGSPYYVYDIISKSFDGRFVGPQGSTYMNFNSIVDKFITGSTDIVYQSTNQHINYLRSEGLCGIGQGGFGVQDPDTSILDNMYLNDGSGLVLSSSSLNNGKLYIVALPNITQHADDYSIRLTANGAVNFTPKSNVSLFIDGYSMASAFDISIGETFDRNFTLASNDGDYVDIPLSTFNNGFYEYDLSVLNSTTRVNGGYDSPYSDLAKYLSSNVNKWSNALYPITSYIGGAKSVGVESYSVSVPEIINNVNDLTKIVVNSAYCDYSIQIVDNKGNASKGVITYHADFVNPSNSSNIIDTLTRTPEQVSEKTTPDNSYNYSPQYPYKPNDNNSIIYPDSSQNNDNSSNSNNNVTVSGGDNSVINNVTVTQNDKYPHKGVMTSFLKIINQDKNDAVKYIGDTSGINGYLHLMQVSMSWIPQEVWSVWISYLKAILGICVGAFFLKILVNWST